MADDVDGRPHHVSIVIPAWNEISRIGATLGAVRAYIARCPTPCDATVVDDGSTDGTGAYVAATYPEVHLHTHTKNQGRGAAWRTGFSATTSDWVLMYDADGSAPIDTLDRCIPLFDETDVIIGCRRMANAEMAQREPLWKRILSVLGNWTIRRMLRLPFRDTQCGFKLFHRRTAPIFDALESQRWGADFELLARARSAGYRIAEVPVTWSHHPASTVHVSGYLRTLSELLRLRRSLRRAITRDPHSDG